MQPIFFSGHQPSGLPHPVPFPSCSFSFLLLAYQLIYVYMSSLLSLCFPRNGFSSLKLSCFWCRRGQKWRLRAWACMCVAEDREARYSATVWRITPQRKRWKLALQSALKMTLIRKFWVVSLWMLHKLKWMLHFTSLGLKKKLNTVCIQQWQQVYFFFNWVLKDLVLRRWGIRGLGIWLRS